ncbi:MAG: sigma-54 dependent transcriptional regulator [Candidatus Aminicenantes bacterium]|nr:sigma-54 dependent transcriptional regulator [Candidatus Aminicenantes bacterium]
MSPERILVIDDEISICSTLKAILEDEGYEVKTVETAEDGLNLLRQQPFDLVMLDIWLPEMNGLEALSRIKENEENLQVIIISGHGTIESAVKATKMGAFDFLEKPLTLEKVVLTVRNALRQKRLEEENLQLKERQKGKFYLLGQSYAIKRLQEEISQIAPSNGRVLIYGENGTGKDYIARFIHQMSQRRDKRFVEINCSAIPDHLMEGELFGYQTEPSPGIGRDRRGKLLQANGGTLFLDEIADMNLKIQAKLVKVIEEERLELLDLDQTCPINVRIIAATSKNLKELINRGHFREDLFFKLNVIPLIIPPLRERPEDIPILIEHFLDHFSQEYGKKPKKMSPEAMEAFLHYMWPGNVSELMNVIERFVILVPDELITADHLTLLVEARELDHTLSSLEGQSLDEARRKFERHYIHRALTKHKWDIEKTAQELRLSAKELESMIRTFNLTFID